MALKEKFPRIYHIYESWSWVTYFGFETPWIADNKCVPPKSISFFNELRKGSCVLHCNICAFQIFPLRLVTSPITIFRDLVSRWIWRSKYTTRIRSRLIERYEKEKAGWKVTTSQLRVG